jgi:hypothetical protein
MKIKWADSMVVWWSYVWRTVVYGAVGGFILGAVAGGIAGATGHIAKAAQCGRITGSIAGLALSTWALKQALEKHLARLTTVANGAGGSVVEIAAGDSIQ